MAGMIRVLHVLGHCVYPKLVAKIIAILSCTWVPSFWIIETTSTGAFSVKRHKGIYRLLLCVAHGAVSESLIAIATKHAPT